jgi:hypothetical protein
MTRTSKRPRESSPRGHFVGARINDETRHLLEVLAQLHQESYAAIIERALRGLRHATIEIGGAYQPGPDDDSDGLPTGFDVAEATWADQEWLRHLKMYLIRPSLVPPKEQAFWREICESDNPIEFWLPTGAVEIGQELTDRFGNHVLAIGVPKEDAIDAAWQQFLAYQRSS